MTKVRRSSWEFMAAACSAAHATIVDVSDAQDGSHLREACLLLVLSEAASTQLEPAPGPNGLPGPGEFFGVGVDAGSVAFVDAAGNVTAIHIDLGIVALEEEDDDDEPSCQSGDAPSPAEAAAGSSAPQQPRQKALFC